MDMSGEQRIPAPRDVVWQALNDPAVLKLCIPGCQDLVKSSDTQMTARVVLKVGPVSARFEGAVTLSDLDPPNSYRISGEGQGGMAGFAKGEARVDLEADGEETLLRYQVEAQVGGKLAQLGARLIDATAKQMSTAFFKRFAAEIVSRQSERQAGTRAPQPGTMDTAEPDSVPARPDRLPPVQPPFVAGQAYRAPSGMWLAGLTVVALSLVACMYLLTSASSAGTRGGASVISSDFAAAVILVLTGAVGYLFGRLQSGENPPPARR